MFAVAMILIATLAVALFVQSARLNDCRIDLRETAMHRMADQRRYQTVESLLSESDRRRLELAEELESIRGSDSGQPLLDSERSE